MAWVIQKKGIDRYSEYVDQVLRDDAEFLKFRRNRDIRGIIDGVTPAAGRSYLKKIRALDSEWIERRWSDIALNDLIGCPDRTYFGCGVPMSPVCMRYAWQALEADRRLELGGKHIVEIGGGYGGLARIICDLFEPASYSIIDIPSVQSLARKYLDRYHLRTPVHMLPTSHRGGSDIVIANYSLAEFDRSEQRSYLDSIVLLSKSAYIVHNIPNPSSKQMSRKEFESILRDKFDVDSYEEGVERSEQSRVFICASKRIPQPDGSR